MADLRMRAADAIRSVQRQVSWKPGSDIRHLNKRIRRGHLPKGTNVADYNQIIRTVVTAQSAMVYIYYYESIPFVAIVATVQTQYWLVMFGLDGLLESAFVLERADLYVNKPVFERLGTLEDVVS